VSCSKQDNFCDGSDFLDEYIILHQHFDLQVRTQENCQKWVKKIN
jgi:hypothetical protein